MTVKEKEMERKRAAMRKLGMTEDEINEAFEDDKLIDRDGRPEYLGTVEEERAMNKAAKVSVPRKPRASGPRERKEDPDKRAIIAKIAALFADCDGFAVENAEKTVNFTLNGADYSINLTKHRAK